MTEKASFELSQGLEVLAPKQARAYPIPCGEWDYLKGRIRAIKDTPVLWHTVGSLFLGASFSTLVAILIGGIVAQQGDNRLTIAWAVVVSTGLLGLMALYFARERRTEMRVKPDDVVSHMELIEDRFETPTEAKSEEMEPPQVVA